MDQEIIVTTGVHRSYNISSRLPGSKRFVFEQIYAKYLFITRLNSLILFIYTISKTVLTADYYVRIIKYNFYENFTDED